LQSKAAATGAVIALITGLFKLCWIILLRVFVIFNLGANYRIKFYLCKKNVFNDI